MKFKDLITISENKNNKQVNLSVRKKQLIKAGLSMKEFLNMKLKKDILKGGKNEISK